MVVDVIGHVKAVLTVKRQEKYYPLLARKANLGSGRTVKCQPSKLQLQSPRVHQALPKARPCRVLWGQHHARYVPGV